MRGRLFCEPASPSREPRASVCEPQKIPAKKSKNRHNVLIWHLLYAGYFIYANTRGTFYQTAPTKGNRTLTILFLFRIPHIRAAGQWTGLSKTERQISVVRSKVIPNISVRRNQNRDLSFDFDQNFRDLWHNENTSGLHVLVHCSMASEVVEIFPVFLYFFQLSRYYRKGIFAILPFGSCSCKRVKRKCRDSVTFQKLTARITRFVNICNRRHEWTIKEIGFLSREHRK